jgi:hypothetical protein
VGKENSSNSFHSIPVRRCDALMSQDQSTQVALNKQINLTNGKNCTIQLNASIDSARYLLNQGFASRGRENQKI